MSKTINFDYGTNLSDLSGRVVFLGNAVSFYGTIDPVTGKIIDGVSEGEFVSQKILVLKGEAGSTVAPWILLTLQTFSKLPLMIISQKRISALVPGVLLTNISLIEGLSDEDFKTISESKIVKIRNKKLLVYGSTRSRTGIPGSQSPAATITL